MTILALGERPKSQKLTPHLIAWIKALPKDQLKAWLAQGEVGSQPLIDFTTGTSFHEARINGVGLAGQHATADDALLFAIETKKQYAAESVGVPVPVYTPPAPKPKKARRS